MDSTNDQFKPTMGQLMICSGTGVAITTLIVNPLDVVKTRMQAQKGKSIIRDGKVGLRKKIPFKIQGTMSGIYSIVRHEGVLTLWSGISATWAMVIPSTVIYFTMYDTMREKMNQYLGSSDQKVWVPMVAGSVARVVAALSVTPLELIRTKMQSEKLRYQDVRRTFRDLVRREGYLALYRGLGPTLSRDVTFSAIYWTSYEYLKSKCNSTESSLYQSFLCGMAAGSVAAVTTLPFDVIKTYRQTELNASGPSKTIEIARILVKRGGVKTLFAGIAPRLIRVAPGCAIMITCYEYGKSYFRHQNSHHKHRPTKTS